MRSNRIRLLGAAGLVATAGLAAASGSTSASVTSAANSSKAAAKIAFVSRTRTDSGPPQSNKLYVINADGSGRKLLTSHAWTATPAWSPNTSPADQGWGAGRWIAFLGRTANRGVTRLHVVNIDGSGEKAYGHKDHTHDAHGSAGPAWSPSLSPGGQGWSKIAFLRPVRGVPQLYVMNADGSQLRRRAQNRAFGPIAWSPDGRTIAFAGEHDGNLDVYVVNPDGGRPLRNLTRSAQDDFAPAWSPNGQKVAFARGDSTRLAAAAIYVMNADGSGLRNLTPGAGGDGDPAWSTDGRRIAFESRRDGNTEIYVMNADGSGQRRLTHNKAGDYGPVWSPDGRTIAFISQRDGHANHEIYVMNADGSGQRNLTNTSAQEDWFAWSPA